MAPYCDLEFSQGPIVQKGDPPTQLSILSESVMDPQALNEVEEESSSISHSDNSENEEDVSLNFKSNIDTQRLHNLLKEENSLVNPRLLTTKQLGTAASLQEAS
uniref:Spindle and centriole-associated protein 1 n=1 Tax=Sphenodon punctatus TaxID=8508 RepID=A0A8D0HJG9_SPHPU